jgi:hypothetical protein
MAYVPDSADLPSVSEWASLLRNAERREKEAKRRLRLVEEACVQSFARGLEAAQTRQAVLEATRGRKNIPTRIRYSRKAVR